MIRECFEGNNVWPFETLEDLERDLTARVEFGVGPVIYDVIQLEFGVIAVTPDGRGYDREGTFFF